VQLKSPFFAQSKARHRKRSEMKFTRRQALRLMGSAAPAMAMQTGLRGIMAQSSAGSIEVTPGKYAGAWPSLKAYSIPDWFADAKFGIWSHWGPQSAVGDGDWYARNMYMEGSAQNLYHVRRFGPPSKVGYKDLVPLFTADRWDPDHLMDLYVKAGAKYFFSMGVHHDNFDMWNSKYQKRWNAVNAGPHKDIVGMWCAAARKRGLRFGVSEHLSNSFDWFAPAHLSDTTGPLAGVPYDGSDPAFSDLYHDYSGEPADFPKTAKAMGRVAPDSWKLEYFHRVKDLVDSYQPDLLYTDGGIPFDEYGLSCVAELYNVGPVDQRGVAEAVYTSKEKNDCAEGVCALDRERGVAGNIWPVPWQTDTCIGGWHYKVGQVYKTPKKVIDLLVDIVSKNGNLLLNFPLPASGELDPEEMGVLEGITAWMKVNDEGIFYSRPWKINGEGPSMAVKIAEPGFNEDKQPDLGAADVRFTIKGKTIYAFVQGWPQQQVAMQSLGTGSPQQPDKVVDVRMLGRDQALRFTQDGTGLHVSLPEEKPATADLGITLRINFV
jgi:alpha-L-fucosidase